MLARLADFSFQVPVNVELDKQGRINIPTPLMEYGKLEKECIVLGVSIVSKFGASRSWEEYFNASEDSFAEIAENMIEFDI